MKFKSIFSEMTKDIDEPIPFKTAVFGKNLLIMIINEDQTYNIYKRKLKKSYLIQIKKCSYLIVPECILRGKKSILIYFYNNPMPVKLKYQYTKVSALTIKTTDQVKKLMKEQAQILDNIKVDAEALQSAFSSNLINKMYAEQSMWTMKNILIIIGALLIVTLVILQVTGTVDVMGMLTGKSFGKG